MTAARADRTPGSGTGARVVVAMLVCLLAGAAATGAALLAGHPSRSPGPAPEHCLAKGSDAVVLAGAQRGRYEQNHLEKATVIDAGSARWDGTEPYVVVAGGTDRVCLTGGSIEGAWPRRTPWDTMHGTGAIVIDAPGSVVEDLRVDGYGDSIRFVERAQDFVVRRVHLSFSRDDCVENDWLHSGTVENSLLDGCYNAFSARPYAGQSGLRDGSHNLWTIRDSLVRLQPMPRPYLDQGLIPGTAGFFKWDARAPRLSLTRNVFRADQRAGTVGLGIPADKLAGCSHNVMVWLGDGPYPDPLPSCFTVTTDVRVWNDAVARWRHQQAS